MKDSKYELRGNYTFAKFCYIFVKLVCLLKGLNFGPVVLTKLKCAEVKQFKFSIVINVNSKDAQDTKSLSRAGFEYIYIYYKPIIKLIRKFILINMGTWGTC